MDKLEVIDKNSEKMLNASKEIRSIIDKLVDEKSFVETDVFMAGPQYIDGTEALGEGVVTGFAYITGSPVCIIAQNYAVLKGSISVTQANKIAKTLDRAYETNCPVISIISSNGARLGEGVAVLEGYSKIIAKANRLNTAHIAIVDGPCVGLMSAYVNECDYVFLNAKKGFISLNPPQVVLSKAKSYAESNVALGKELAKKSLTVTKVFDSYDDVCNDIYKLMYLLFDGEREDVTDDPNRVSVKLNKDQSVPNLLKAIYDDSKYVTFYDEYAKEVVCALGIVNGVTSGIIATDGSVNDGLLSVKGLKKIKKYLEFLIKFDMPLITLVDSKGIETTLPEEQEGVASIAADIFTYISDMDDVAKVAVITKNAVGFSYSLLASKAVGFNYTLAFCDSYISPVNADTAVEILAVDDIKAAKDPVAIKAKLEKAYVEDAANPYVTAKEGFIDNIIEPAVVRPYIISILNILMGY